MRSIFRWLKILAVISLFIACSEKSVRPGPPQPTQPPSSGENNLNVLKNFVDLVEASNYFTALHEEMGDARLARREPKKILSCDPPESRLEGRLMRLKSWMDQEAQNLQKRFKKMGVQRALDPFVLNCENTCSCGDILEVLQDVKFADEKVKITMQKKHDALTKKSLYDCAQNMTSFCSSSLFAKIMDE